MIQRKPLKITDRPTGAKPKAAWTKPRTPQLRQPGGEAPIGVRNIRAMFGPLPLTLHGALGLREATPAPSAGKP
eukprot:11125812-Heterocapsa_arctica.AAC.1